MAHIGLAKLQELEKVTADRERAILARMQASESEPTEEVTLPTITEDLSAITEEQVTIPEPFYIPNTHMYVPPRPKPFPDPSCIQTPVIKPKPAPTHSVELVYDSGKEGMTGSTDKFSVKVFASEINEDDDNISIILDCDVLIKPPSYTELQVKIDNKQPVKVMMGGTIKHGDDRFLFLLKVK